MDYFGKYTEHIRYLTSLSGNFTSCSNRVRLLCMVLILPALFVTSVLSARSVVIPVMMLPFIVLVLIGVTLFLSSNLPCSYSADECGFKICTGLFTRYFEYREVNSVVVENRLCRHSKRGAYFENVLTVSTDDHIYRFKENCGIPDQYEAARGDSLNGHTELIKLTEFIRSRLRGKENGKG